MADFINVPAEDIVQASSNIPAIAKSTNIIINGPVGNVVITQISTDLMLHIALPITGLVFLLVVGFVLVYIRHRCLKQ